MKPQTKALASAAVFGVLAWIGWRTQEGAGLAMVVSAALFLGLLQFHRAMSVLRRASRAPVGWVPSAVMLHSRLRAGLPLADLLRMTGSLGLRLDDAGDAHVERFAWRDNGEVEVRVRLRDGKVLDWTFLRPGEQPVDGPLPG